MSNSIKLVSYWLASLSFQTVIGLSLTKSWTPMYST